MLVELIHQFDIAAPETVDRLLRVSHEPALPDILREDIEYADLYRIAVLELVHEEVVYRRAYIFENLLLSQKLKKESFHIVEIHQPLLDLHLPV